MNLQNILWSLATSNFVQIIKFIINIKKKNVKYKKKWSIIWGYYFSAHIFFIAHKYVPTIKLFFFFLLLQVLLFSKR